MRPSRLLTALAALLVCFFVPAHAQTSSLPPTPPVKLAMNPVTNKLYIVNTGSNSVTVLHADGTTSAIPVGPAPGFIAVNPVTNRIYVDNNDATLTVIDGGADSVLATYPIGSVGPITVNPLTNVIYIVRLTGTGSDEVTYFNGATNSWYTIATSSFQPNAMAVNPATNTIFVTHYSTGDVRVISGAFDPAHDFPATTSIGVFSHPFAIAANPVTNKAYVITQDARGPVVVIDGATNRATFPTVAAGHATGPQAIAVNPVTNKAYAAFANEVIVIAGGTNALTYIPITGAASGGIALGINYTTNRIFVATAQGAVTVIDGDTDTVFSTGTTSTGSAPSVGVNPVLDAAYFFDATLTSTTDGTGDTVHAMPITTSIDPLPNDTSGASGTLTLHVASSFSPAALPANRVYYQLDSRGGAWTPASGSGPFTATFSNLAPGAHTVYAFAVDGQDAPLATGPQSIPLVGDVVSYSFTVASQKVAATVSIASSANPSPVGQSVTFTASVSGSAGLATGTLGFLDGTVALTGCSSLAMSGGSAACATSSLSAGSHSITAAYSGDAHYTAATSATLTQTVNASAASITSPAPGATLTGSSQLFEWNNSGAALYQLWVGSTLGAHDLGFFPQNGTTGTSVTATGIPTDGRTLYVRLYSSINGAYQFRDFTYTASGSGATPPAPADITSPMPGSTLTGTSQLFQWNASGASLYQLWVGSTQGAYDVGFFPQSGTTDTSITATGIPTDGRTLYVRLYSAINGAWQFKDFTFTASGSGAVPASPASLTSPVPGSTLTGTSQLFQWNASGASLYQLWVGSTQGAYDVGFFPQSGTTGTSVTATGLPTDGRTLYVRLYSAINGAWQFRDFTYTASGSGGFTPTPAVITSPAPGGTLSGSTVTFNWNAASGASLYQLWVGTSQGTYDVGYFPASGTTATTATATGLPTDGRTLFVRLYTAIGNTWYFNDYTYKSGP